MVSRAVESLYEDSVDVAGRVHAVGAGVEGRDVIVVLSEETWQHDQSCECHQSARTTFRRPQA